MGVDKQTPYCCTSAVGIVSIFAKSGASGSVRKTSASMPLHDELETDFRYVAMLQISDSSSFDVPSLSLSALTVIPLLLPQCLMTETEHSRTCAVLHSVVWSQCFGKANTHQNSGLHHACQLSDFSLRRLAPLLQLCAVLRDHSLLALHIIRPLGVSARLKFERRVENAREPRREKPLEPGLYNLRIDMSYTHGQEGFECTLHVSLRENQSAVFGFGLESRHDASRKVVEHCEE